MPLTVKTICPLQPIANNITTKEYKKMFGFR
jgi:hypothetical protein